MVGSSTNVLTNLVSDFMAKVFPSKHESPAATKSATGVSERLVDVDAREVLVGDEW